MEKYAELIVKDFRAISDADITLNGITVVAGNNGCGKSSLSKLLYYIYHYANDYESIATNIVKKHISEYCDALGTLWHIASEQNQEDVFLEYLEKNFSKYKRTRYNITVTKKRYVTDSEKNDLKNLTDVEHIDITNCSYILFERITQKINYFDSDINNRRYDWFAEKVEDKFAVNELKNVRMEEFGETIFGEGTKNLPEIQYVKKIAYVESPINFGRDKMPIDYVNELNELAKQPPLREYAGSSINDIISRGVMNGDSTFDKEFFSAVSNTNATTARFSTFWSAPQASSRLQFCRCCSKMVLSAKKQC
ncbi:MAG: AAA family ATPase [Bacteroidales bacterium]|nr:AAA family ATPase [Bacteroidales bacterium]